MRRQKKQITWKETFSLHFRCICEMFVLFPKRFYSLFLHDIFFSCHPYVTTYLFARIIDEIAGQCRLSVVFRLISVTLAVETAVSVIQSILKSWEKKERNISRRAQWKSLYAKKMMNMSYSTLDNQKTHDLWAQIEQSERAGDWGIDRAIYYVDVLISSFLGVVGAVVLLLSLFITQVPGENSAWGLLNNPWIVLLFLAIWLAAVFASAISDIKAIRRWSIIGQEMKYENRCFHAYCKFGSSPKAGADIRLSHPQNLIKKYLNEADAYCFDGKLAKAERGYIGIQHGISALLSSFLDFFVYLFVGLKAIAGAFGVGSVMQYVGAFKTLSSHLSRLVQSIGNMKSNTPFLKRVYTLLDMPLTTDDGSLKADNLDASNIEIEFENVSFKYPGSNDWALRDINLKIKGLISVALVGENGSGKSTFIKLLCRLYDPQIGRILVNGRDVREYSFVEYLKFFSIVFQDYQLLSQPLGSNVAAQTEYDYKRAEQALINAGFETRLRTTQYGLDSFIYKDFGKEGIDVSSGEAQKIAIARALYKESPVIILDEPTATLDPIAEAELYSRLIDIASNKTVIFTSHRLSSCTICDKIIVFHNGRIIEKGTHSELIAQNTGKYFELWTSQQQYYK